MASGLFDVLPRTARLSDGGRLTVGGCALADVAEEFGTPALVFDEQGLRDSAREYLAVFRERHADSDVHFASKALPCAPLLRVLADEGLGCDVASAGELAIALAAGFDPARILVHGNAKSDEDIGDALNAGVGLIVIDNADDVDRLERLGARGQRVLIRVNPAVPGETHAAVDTGSAEAKFGVALDAAPALIKRVAGVPGLELLGLHVHIGSQLLDLDGFDRAAQAIAALGRFAIYDLGGGLGIAYRPGDEGPSVGDYAEATVRALREHLDAVAHLIVEPGRSLVGRSGVTLYSVVTVKRGARTHVAVDGGMGDNSSRCSTARASPPPSSTATAHRRPASSSATIARAATSSRERSGSLLRGSAMSSSCRRPARIATRCSTTTTAPVVRRWCSSATAMRASLCGASA